MLLGRLQHRFSPLGSDAFDLDERLDVGLGELPRRT